MLNFLIQFPSDELSVMQGILVASFNTATVIF